MAVRLAYENGRSGAIIVGPFAVIEQPYIDTVDYGFYQCQIQGCFVPLPVGIVAPDVNPCSATHPNGASGEMEVGVNLRHKLRRRRPFR